MLMPIISNDKRNLFLTSMMNVPHMLANGLSVVVTPDFKEWKLLADIQSSLFLDADSNQLKINLDGREQCLTVYGFVAEQNHFVRLLFEYIKPFLSINQLKCFDFLNLIAALHIDFRFQLDKSDDNTDIVPLTVYLDGRPDTHKAVYLGEYTDDYEEQFYSSEQISDIIRFVLEYSRDSDAFNFIPNATDFQDELNANGVQLPFSWK